MPKLGAMKSVKSNTFGRSKHIKRYKFSTGRLGNATNTTFLIVVKFHKFRT